MAVQAWVSASGAAIGNPGFISMEQGGGSGRLCSAGQRWIHAQVGVHALHTSRLQCVGRSSLAHTSVPTATAPAEEF